MAKIIGIDLGTANSLVCVKNKGIVLRQPTVVAISKADREIVALGSRARSMLGKTPAGIEAIKPLRDGVVSHPDITAKLIKAFFEYTDAISFFSRPSVIICVPYKVTEVEKRAVEDAVFEAGARSVALIEEPLAAAIGTGLRVGGARGNMIVDIGGGTTDVAVISLGGVVVYESKKAAGDKFDEAIMRYVRRKYNIAIGERTAEQIKIRIGAVYEHPQAKMMNVKGRCLVKGLPKEVTLSSKEMLEAMMEPISEILDSICSVIERTPPDLVGDILKHGIVMTGGGSQLYGLDRLIEDVTSIKTRVAPEPMLCVAKGTGILVKNLDDISITGDKIDLSKRKRVYSR